MLGFLLLKDSLIIIMIYGVVVVAMIVILVDRKKEMESWTQVNNDVHLVMGSDQDETMDNIQLTQVTVAIACFAMSIKFQIAREMLMMIGRSWWKFEGDTLGRI